MAEGQIGFRNLSDFLISKWPIFTKSGLLRSLAPPKAGFFPFAVTQFLVQPDKKRAQPRRGELSPKLVEGLGEILVEWTNPNANGAIRSLGRPEFEALFRVYRPLLHPGQVRNGELLFRRRPIWDGFGRARLGAAAADVAKFTYAKGERGVCDEREVGEHLGDANSRSKLGCDKHPMAPALAKSGLNRERNR